MSDDPTLDIPMSQFFVWQLPHNPVRYLCVKHPEKPADPWASTNLKRLPDLPPSTNSRHHG